MTRPLRRSLAPLLHAIEGLDAGGRALLFALCENAQVRPAAQPHASCNCISCLLLQLHLMPALSSQADSEWRLYFDFLPRDFQTPLQWNDAELLLLQASHARAMLPTRACC